MGGCFEADRVGLSGELVLFWKNSVVLDFHSFFIGLIDMMVRHPGKGLLRLTCLLV